MTTIEPSLKDRTDGLTELECGKCEKPFQVSVYTNTSWTCEPMEQNP